MRRKPLIIGLFTAALVAGAVPVAFAGTYDGSGGSCRTVQYKVAKGTTFRFHPAGKAPSQELKTTADAILNSHGTHAGAKWDNEWQHGNAYVEVNGKTVRVSDVDVKTGELGAITGCW